MPKLSCTVTDCTHNKDNCCCLDVIKVGGTNATAVQQTECDSFAQKDDVVRKIVSAIEKPVTDLYIQCKATNCCYNNDYSCTAENVHICGEDCCNCADTQCDTFKSECN